MKTRTIRQQRTFKASPHDVYEALMDSEKHSGLTGARATISRDVGGSFSAYDGGLNGTNLELATDERIVQAWRAEDDGWPPGHYSRATFSLESVPSGTRLTFRQSGVPEVAYEDIKQGWIDYYWRPMKRMLEEAG